MKNIVYNSNNLQEKDINKVTRRAKAIIVNDKHEILWACVNHNHHLPGGHLEENESYDECLVREIKEELGVDIPLEKREPLIVITYYNKDYPEKGDNTKTVVQFYEVKENITPNLNNINLTEDEKEGNFELKYIKEDEVLDFLKDSLKLCTRKPVVLDTIAVLEEYLSIKR